MLSRSFMHLPRVISADEAGLLESPSSAWADGITPSLRFQWRDGDCHAHLPDGAPHSASIQAQRRPHDRRPPLATTQSYSKQDLAIVGVGLLVDEPPEKSDLSTVPAGIEILGETLHANTLRCFE